MRDKINYNYAILNDIYKIRVYFEQLIRQMAMVESNIFKLFHILH